MLDLLVMAALAAPLQPGTIALDCRNLPCPLDVELRHRVAVEIEVEVPAELDELGTEIAPATTATTLEYDYVSQSITLDGEGTEIELPEDTVIEVRSSSHWIESILWTGRNEVLDGAELANAVFSFAEGVTPISTLQYSATGCDSGSIERLDRLPMAWTGVSGNLASLPIPAGCAHLVVRPDQRAPIPTLNLEVDAGSTIDLEPSMALPGGSALFRLIDDRSRPTPDRGVLLLAQRQVPTASLPDQQKAFADENAYVTFVGVSPGGWNPAPWDEDIPDQRAETLVIENGELTIARDRVFERPATLVIYPAQDLPIEQPMLIVHRKPVRDGELVRVSSPGVESWEQALVQFGIDDDMLLDRSPIEITPLLSGFYNIVIRDLQGGRVVVLAEALELRAGEEEVFYLEMPIYHVTGKVSIGGRGAQATVTITDRIKKHVIETDRSGRFEADLLSSGRAILTVDNLDLGITRQERLDIVESETEVVVDFPIGTISGTVSPASLGLEAIVFAKKGGLQLKARVDTSGNFTIRGVAKGTWMVWAEVDGKKGRSLRAKLSDTNAAAGGLNLRLPDNY